MLRHGQHSGNGVGRQRRGEQTGVHHVQIGSAPHTQRHCIHTPSVAVWAVVVRVVWAVVVWAVVLRVVWAVALRVVWAVVCAVWAVVLRVVWAVVRVVWAVVLRAVWAVVRTRAVVVWAVVQWWWGVYQRCSAAPVIDDKSRIEHSLHGSPLGHVVTHVSQIV